MARRRRNPETHDNRVRREAAKLNSEGWDIQADLPGYESPEPIGKDNRVPDILATKGNKVKIIEVETPDTVDSHKDQQATFRRSAAQRQNAEFELVVTVPRKL